jgi:hypothetical protein
MCIVHLTRDELLDFIRKLGELANVKVHVPPVGRSR